MPFEQKYSAETRAAATERAVELRKADPKDRTIIRVVSEEFGVGAQSLRGWLKAAAPAETKPAKRGRRPKFSPVVTTRIEPVLRKDVATAFVARPPSEPYAQTVQPSVTAGDLSMLEREVAELREGNEALMEAMRIVLSS